MSNPIIAPYVAPYRPLNNITPFTIRDGVTYIEKLHDIIEYMNTDIIGYVNKYVPELGDSFEEAVNEIVTAFNAAVVTVNESVDTQLTDNLNAVQAAIDTVINNSITVNDALVETLVTSDSDTRDALDARYALASALATLADDVAALDLTDINAALSGRLSVTALNDAYATKSVETTVNAGRLTDANLNAKVDSRAAALFGSTIDGSVASLVTADSQLKTALDAEYISTDVFIGRQIRVYSTQAVMNAATDINTNDLAIVENIPGAYFRRVLGAWMMEGVAVFGTGIARDAAITAPLTTMRSRVATESFDREYNGTRWNPVSGRHLLSTNSINATNTLALINAFSDDFNEYDIILDFTSSNAAGEVYINLRSAGANVTTNYVSRHMEAASNNTVFTAATTSAAYIGRLDASGGAIEATIINPKINRPTRIFSRSIDSNGNHRSMGSIHSLASAYTDCAIVIGGGVTSASATVKVYGKI